MSGPNDDPMAGGEKVKLLIAAHSANRGGAEYCLDTFLAHLDRRRFEAQVLFPWEGPMAELAQAKGYPVEIWPWAWWMMYEPSGWHVRNATLGSLWRTVRLVQRLRRERIDLVYTNTAVIFEPGLAARLARIPHVWHVHEILTSTHTRPHLVPLQQIVRLIGRWSHRVVFESNTARQVCKGRIPEAKMRTVYNSVRFPGSAMPAAQSPPRPCAEPIDHPCQIVWIGRFSERKDPLSFLEAAARVQQTQQCRFLLIGAGPMEAQVRETIVALDLSDRCQILPFQEDVRPILEASDFLVLTSREESFGLVLVEAAVFGLPAVATRTQGPTEIILPGQTGFLVEPGDPAGLAEAMDRLAGNPMLRGEMGRAAAQRAQELFHPEKNTRQLEQILLEALAEGTSRA